MMKELLSDGRVGEIMSLLSHVKEEIADAKKYAMLACKYKADAPSMCATFGKLANEELGHADTIQAMAADKLATYERNGAEVPEKLGVIWDYEKDQMMDEIACVRAILSSCR